MAQNAKERKWFSEEVYDVVGHILAGTTEQAEEVLKGFRGYKPIPGINMMTGHMVAKLSRGGMRKYTVSEYAGRCGVPHVKGRWETDDGNLVSISDYLKAAGIDCEPSEGMKMVGCGPRNCRVNLYDPKGILALLYACARSRSRVEGKIRRVYGLESVEPVSTEIVPAPAGVEYSATFNPEFVTELIRVCVRESVSAMLAFQAKQ